MQCFEMTCGFLQCFASCSDPLPVHVCRVQLSLADFDLERRLGEGSYAQVRPTGD